MDAIEVPDRGIANARGSDSGRMPPETPPVAAGAPAPRAGTVFGRPSSRHGRPWIWSSAAGLLVVGAMLAGILAITLTEGLGHFWPAAVAELRLTDGRVVLGEVKARGERQSPGGRTRDMRRLVRVGHREVTGANDFVWLDDAGVAFLSYPDDAWTVERMEYGNLYGWLHEVRGAGSVGEALEKGAEVRRRLEAVRDEMGLASDPLSLSRLEKSRFELEKQGLRTVIVWRVAGGERVETAAFQVIRAYRPNDMGLAAKVGHYVSRLREFLTTSPRESNTEGGILPVIMGTLFLVILMTLAAVPMGVMAAVYLQEYAREGPFLRAVRLAMANLAGVPSIVFGIFGLGLFVYTIGGGMDATLFPGRGHPTFGTGGLLWGALTLALLTVPVVIVAAGEGLASVPRSFRDGALALGATRWQTIWNVVLPQALPGILTGTILAIGRGAGEVAPLMVLGAAVKLAPQPVVDSAFPFLHADRKFTHLGFHIYDVSMQSPNVEAAKPMTYASTLTLMLLVLGLNLIAILLRARLRRRFQGSAL